MFAYIRDVGKDTKEFIQCDHLFELNKLQFKAFQPKNLKDFSLGNLYGRVVTDKDGVAWMAKCRIVTLRDTLEEFEKLQKDGKLPRSVVAKYESSLKPKELYSTFLRCEELVNVKSRNGKRHTSKPTNESLTDFYKKKIDATLGGSLLTAGASIGLDIVQNSLEETHQTPTTSLNDTETGTLIIDEDDRSSCANDGGPSEVANSLPGSPLQGLSNCEPITDPHSSIVQMAPGHRPAGHLFGGIKGNTLIRVQRAFDHSSSSKMPSPFSTLFGGQSAASRQSESSVAGLSSNEGSSEQLPMDYDAKIKELSEDIEGIKKTTLTINQKLDQVLELLVKGAPSGTDISNAVTLDEEDTTEPKLSIQEGHVHLGGPRTLRRTWAESIVSSNKSTLQWKVRQLVEKLYDHELKTIPVVRYYLELPIKEADQTPEDALFPDSCIQGLCNFINLTNENNAKSVFLKEKQKLKVIKNEEERLEKIEELKVTILGSIERLTIVDIRKVLTKVLYALRPPKVAVEPPSKKQRSEEQDNTDS